MIERMADYIQWLRSKIGPIKVPVVFACAIVLNEKDEVLWQQRGDFGWWGLPGGVVEIEESLSETVIREIYEETGLTAQVERFLGIYSSPDFDVTYPNGDQVQQITFTFVCRVNGGQPHIDQDETLALSWLDPKELPQTSPWYTAMLQDFRKPQNGVFYQHGSSGGRANSEPLYKMLRKYIGQAAYVAAGSGAIILDEHGRILLQRRSDNGEWGIPGGALELGERIDETIRQEVWEETGLYVKIDRISGVYSDQRFFVSYPNGDQMKVAAVIFVCSVTGGIMTADGEESLELRYFERDKLPALPAHILTVIHDALDPEKHFVIS